MLNTRPRRSTSAVSYTETEANSIQSHLNQLRRLLNDDPPQKTYQLLQLSIEHFHLIRQSFFENANPNRIRDAFRNLDGFQILLNLLRKSSTLLVQKDSTVEEQKTVLDFIHSVLGTLCTALQNHWGNRKYFRKRVENGGWITINTILKTLIEAHRKSGHDTKDVQERLFGYLLACGLEDEALNDLFSKLGRSICQYRERGTGDNVTTVAEQTIQTDLGSQTFLHNPDTLLILLDLWIGAIGSPQRSSDAILCHLPTVFRLVLRSSTHNLVAAHEAGLLSRILPLFLNASLSPQLANEFQHLTVTLLNLGVTNLDDAYFLYKNAASSSIIAETLHRTLKEPFTPPFIHFDLSLHGYASVELPDLGRTFPPNSSSPGYTFAAWFQVINFDSDSHTTIFGAFDSSQTCFVLVYLEKDTRNLILQTSVTSSRPSVRFKTFVFEPAKWYHLCIVHRRPKTTSSSRASLFVNGEFVEQVKAHYPAAPPVNSGSSPANLLSVGQKHKAVQAFLGTPQDLATRLGHGAVKSQWRLASAYLLSDALSDDLIAVHKELGPRYHGNYQDCLGSFQTYEASAALNLRNENLHPGKEEKSDIVAAIRSRASELLPETKYLLNVSPMMILDDDDRNNVDETQLMRFVSKTASKNMRHATRGGRSAIVINGAIPSINEALLHACGFALLTGNPAVTVPWALDDVTWCIGGCGPIGLTLVESAQTHEEIIRALEILCATVKYSWRNSEAMERENGFGVLASLLAEKISLAGDDPVANESLEDVETEQDMLAYSILLTILEFVGYNVQSPENSIINNPLAYRVLLVDLDIWRTMSTPVQKLYYEQFTTFSVGSKHHLFNAKRLARMRKDLSGSDLIVSTKCSRYHQKMARGAEGRYLLCGHA